MKKDCCSEVLPQNSARTFNEPASIIRKILKDAWIQKEQRILEIGSGCLRNSDFLVQKGFQVTAKELPIVVKKYRKKYDRFAKNGGIILTSSPISSTFDAVISTFTLETICRKTERMKMLEELIGSLKVGGKLVLSVRGMKDVKTATGKGQRCGDGYITPQKTFIKPFTVRELVSLLSLKGLNVLKIYRGSKQNEPKIIEVVAESMSDIYLSDGILTPQEWLERYYEHLGDEIGVAFNTINVNTGWALTLLSLLLSAIFLSGIFPDIRSFFVLMLISLLLIRFYVRTTLGYQNLLRWNHFRNRIDKIFLGVDKDGSIKTDLLKSIDLYDWRWFSPWPRRRLFFANLRYGYAAMFLLTYGLAVFAWMALDSTTIFSPSPDRCLAIAVVFAASVFTLMEIKGLFDPFYFKHIKSDDVTFDENSGRVKAPVYEQKRRTVSQRVISIKRPLYATTLLLLFVSVIFLAWPVTHSVIITEQKFPQTIRGYSLSDPLELSSGDKVTFDWYSTSPLVVVIAEKSAIDDFNKTGVLANVTGIYYGQSGHATAVFSENVPIIIMISCQSLNGFTGQIRVQSIPNARLGTIVGGVSILPLLAVVISQATDLISQEKHKILK